MVKILHFADAHIDSANFGQHDPNTGLPLRVMDFLKSLDIIIDTAIAEKVDLVIFAGDTYKDRSPAPTFQREWGRRIMRLSRASVPTILLTGNHDISPSQLRAHALQEFETLAPEFTHVISKLGVLKPEDLDGVQVQVIGIPWITRSGVVAAISAGIVSEDDTSVVIEQVLTAWLQEAILNLDPELPTILTAHASIAGAKFGNEQTIKIGRDVVLPPGLVINRRFDYVALGHIHRYQDLNEGAHPPVIYPGSIERVDFGEVKEDKGFVIAEVSKGHTDYTWHKLPIRPVIDRSVTLEDALGVNERIVAALPEPAAMEGAIVRMTVHYPRDLETMINEAGIRDYARNAFEFKLVKNPDSQARTRLPGGLETSVLTPTELLDLYWKQNHVSEEDRARLSDLADRIISQVNSGEEA